MKKFVPWIPICLIYAGFIAIVRLYFWSFPSASDPLEYIQSLQWGSTDGGFWPWLDRIAFACTLAVLKLFPGPLYAAAPYYGLFVTLVALIGAGVWLRHREGSGAGLFFIAIQTSSFLLYKFSAQIFPEPTLIAFLIVAFIGYRELNYPGQRKLKLFVLGFAAFGALLTKIVVIPTALVILFLGYQKCKESDERRALAGGVAIAGLTILLVFLAAYGWRSLRDVLHEFYHSNFATMMKGVQTTDAIVSFYDLFADRGYLPVFLALFVSVGLYRDRSAREFALIAWVLGLTVQGIYLVTGRSGALIAQYMMPMYYFFSIALSIYWGKRLRLTNAPLLEAALGMGVFIALAVGWWHGYEIENDLLFDPGRLVPITPLAKALMSFGILVLAVTPTVLELFPRRRLEYIALILVPFFSILYNGGRAKVRFEIVNYYDAAFYYEYAPLLNRIPGDTFTVYVKKWAYRTSLNRLIPVFAHFFNTKYALSPGPNLQRRTLDELSRKIQIFSRQADLVRVAAPIIAADNLDDVRKIFPKAVRLGEVDFLDLHLFIMRLHPDD